MDKYFTFLYVKRGNQGVKSIRIPKLMALSSAVVFCAAVVLVLVYGSRYAGYIREGRTAAELKAENEMLRRRLDLFQDRMSDVKGRMENNFELQNRARLLAGLDPLSRDVWKVGIGGPEPRNLARSDSSGYLFSSAHNDLDVLVRQSRLQLESYREIIDVLEKEQEVRDCTPSIRPLKGGFLSSRFGRRMDPFSGRVAMHKGIDYCARNGTSVKCTADGVVTMAKKNGSFGLVVEVNHGNGFRTKYAHLSKILVRRGQRVKRHEVIGLVGNTGLSTGPHLHYEVVFRGVPRNPLHYVIPDDYYFD